MTESPKISLLTAILININIMLGSGIFINTALLTGQAGALGAGVYLLVGILLLPLILAIAQLLKYHHGVGTFYHFGLSLSPFFGFISALSYFAAKLCSCALGVHVCVSFLQQIIPVLQVIPTLVFDSALILCFTALNLLNLSIGKSIQYTFMIFKLIPILFAIFAGLFLFSGSNFTSTAFMWAGVPLSVPLVLYAFTGFESSCSISRHIKNPEKNGPKAILISYGIVITIAVLYQTMFFGSLGQALGSLAGGYLSVFPALLTKLLGADASSKNTLQSLLHIGIASSSLGSSYGIMFSNSWNLHALAENNHVFKKKLFLTLNKYSAPILCVITEGLIALTYLWVTKGNQVPLQQVSALGGTIAYTLSSLALLILTYRRYNKITLLPVLSLLSCCLLISSFIWSISIKGPTSLLIVFFGILIFGSYMFFKKHEPSSHDEIFEKI
ncbi:amino acid permease [Candidatus Dependentiae bacterium]|nr:amino acid permease [Candidatus Dependentiae bacterium]